MKQPLLRKRYRLRLYVAGLGPYTNQAKKSLADAGAEVGFDYDLEVIDLRAEPHRASLDRVVVTPTLVKVSPLPRAIVIGDLSDPKKIVTALGTMQSAK